MATNIKTVMGHPVVTPVLIVAGARKLIAFMEAVFGGEQQALYPGEGDAIAHAEVKIGDALVMCCDPMPDFPVQTGRLMLYTNNLQATYEKALAHGAKSLTPPEEHKEYGMATARVQDPWGNYWSIAQAL
jgi:uncharacterized glyoxalase superfamily protein PhnB